MKRFYHHLRHSVAVVSRFVKLALVDALLLSATYFVIVDLQWRNDYAAEKGLGTSISYSLFTHVFSMTSPTTSLQSPLTLDWLQVLIAVMVVVNVVLLRPSLGKKLPTSG